MNISKKQLTKLNKFKKAGIPILETLLFDASTLTAVNLAGGRQFEVPVFYQLSHRIDVTGRGCIPAEEFVKIARKYTIEKIVFNEKYKAEIVTGCGSFHIQGEAPEDFPTVPAIDSEPDLTIEKDLIKDLESFTSTDDLRPSMCGIFFDADNNVGVAADGHKMKFTTLGRGTFESFILPNAAIKLTEADKYEHFPATGGETYGKFEAIATPGKSEIIFYQTIDEKYPNWRGVWPKDKDQRITADKKELVKFLEAAKITASNTTGQIELRVENNAAQIYAADIDLETEYKSPYFGNARRFIEGETFTAGFNVNLFLDVLKSVDSDTINIDGVHPNKAHIINENTLLMPVMLGSYA